MASLIDNVENDLVRGCRHITRIRHALTVTGFPDHLAKIEACGPGAYCNTPYCLSCRTRHVRNHSSRLFRLHRTLHNDCEMAAREDIRFVTVLHALTPMDIKSVKMGLSNGKKDLAGLRRSFPGIKLFGRFELEVVDTGAIFSNESNRQKAMALTDLNDGNINTPHREMVLVHSHFLLFLGGNDPEFVRNKMTIRFPGRYAIKMDRLYKDLSVCRSLKNITSYMLKDRYLYNNSMETDGYKEGTYLSDEALSFMVRSYMSYDIGIDRCLIYSKGM